MFRVANCIADEHDLVALAVASLICFFGSLISLSAVRRAIRSKVERSRRRDLCLAGLMTGLTIWSTHFAAMIGYTPGVDVRFNLAVACSSALFAVALSTVGWYRLALGGRRAWASCGFFVGLALAVAHFLDMSALRVAGLVSYDLGFIAAALVLGFSLCLACSWALQWSSGASLPRLSTGLFVAAILTLHLVAMAGVTVTPARNGSFGTLDLGIRDLTMLVTATSAFILLTGVGLAWHAIELSRVTAEERQRLKRSEEHHRFSVELNPQIPWIADATGNVLEVSSRWSEVVGIPVERAIGMGWLSSVHPDDVPEVKRAWSDALSAGSLAHADVRYRVLCVDKTYRWFRARAHPRRDELGQIIMWYGSLEDINDQVHAEEALRASEERYQLASRAANDVIWDVRVESSHIEWSGAFEEVLGDAEAKSGTSREWFIDRLHPADRADILSRLEHVMKSHAESWCHELRFRLGNGSYAHLLIRGFIVRDLQGKPLRMVGSLVDVTAKKRAEDELRWAAYHDPLTNLPNRKLFNMRLDEALHEAASDGKWVGLVVVDVDRFKTLNDTMGHGAGDAVLRTIAERLSSNVPEGATVARLGGDEFAIIMPRLIPSEARRDTLDRILEGSRNPIFYDGREIDVTLSIGAAKYPSDAADAESLLKSADLALYAAKADGLGKARGFVSAMRQEAEHHKKMLHDARGALRSDGIVPFYQPKICLRTGALIGFEALLRWHDAEQGIQAPATLLAAFDDPRLAPEITDRMLAQTNAHMREWLDKGLEFGRIAINATSEDFRRGDLADRMLNGLAKADIASDRVELEVTETVLLGRHGSDIDASLRCLRAANVTIAFDDFGTGYASLTHLRQFPVDTIKIDRSFISGLVEQEEDSAIIVGALVDLAKKLGIATVAEGVETEFQASMLRRLGCEAAQGYLFARPLPALAVPGFMARWKNSSQPALWKQETATSNDSRILAFPYGRST